MEVFYAALRTVNGEGAVMIPHAASDWGTAFWARHERFATPLLVGTLPSARLPYFCRFNGTHTLVAGVVVGVVVQDRGRGNGVSWLWSWSRSRWLWRRFEVAVVVEDKVYGPDEQASHQTNWDNYITISHHVLGAKTQKLMMHEA